MEVTATVRVKAEHGEKPDRARLQQAADHLEQAGFTVLKVGRFGVSVKGEQSDFSRVLGVEAAPNRSMNAKAKPSHQPLEDLVDGVEVASEPQLY